MFRIARFLEIIQKKTSRCQQGWRPEMAIFPRRDAFFFSNGGDGMTRLVWQRGALAFLCLFLLRCPPPPLFIRRHPEVSEAAEAQLGMHACMHASRALPAAASVGSDVSAAWKARIPAKDVLLHVGQRRGHLGWCCSGQCGKHKHRPGSGGFYTRSPRVAVATRALA